MRDTRQIIKVHSNRECSRKFAVYLLRKVIELSLEINGQKNHRLLIGNQQNVYKNYAAECFKSQHA